MSRLSDEATLVDAPVDIDEFSRFIDERRWGDGLPVVPATEQRVSEMLRHAKHARDHVIAVVAPNFGAATVERIAINAVMAGCLPELMPVLITVVEAAAAQEFNLQGVQVTTHAVATWIIMNGPLATKLGFAGSFNCLGQGARANATLGRALRLILQNVGGALPGDMDRATQGQPGKYSFCCAENEAESPWLPLHVERGIAPDRSAATIVPAGGTLSMNTHAKDAPDLLRVIAESMIHPTGNDYSIGGEPWIILSPEHARILHGAGLGKADVKRELWERSKMAAGRMAAKDLGRTRIGRGEELGAITEKTLLPICVSPDDIGIIVAGGPGTHSVYVPGFGPSRAVTRQVEE